MKTTFKSLIAMAFAGLLFVGCATKQADSCCAPMGGMSGMSGMKSVEYEYKIVRIETPPTTFEKQLNDASKGGWKLVPIISQGADSLIFERPKQ